MDDSLDSWFAREILVHEESLVRYLARSWPKPDEIHDLRTGQVYRGGPAAKGEGPHRQFALLSLYPGKEGNRYIVLAATSEMGLVGLVETLADPKRLDELARTIGDAGAAEALYQVDSQGSGVLAVRMLVTNRRDQRRIWQP